MVQFAIRETAHNWNYYRISAIILLPLKIVSSIQVNAELHNFLFYDRPIGALELYIERVCARCTVLPSLICVARLGQRQSIFYEIIICTYATLSTRHRMWENMNVHSWRDCMYHKQLGYGGAGEGLFVKPTMNEIVYPRVSWIRNNFLIVLTFIIHCNWVYSYFFVCTFQ